MICGDNSGLAWVVMGTAGRQHLERFNHLAQNSSNAKWKGMVAHFNGQSKDQAPFSFQWRTGDTPNDRMLTVKPDNPVELWRGGIMLNHKLLCPEGILVLEHDVPLESADFEGLAQEIDPFIAEHGKLSGVMIHTKTFSGWVNLEAFLAHMRFIESHHRKIKRLAVVSDSSLLAEMPKIVDHLVHAEVKHFPPSAYEEAWRWLREEVTPTND